jgi:hypothetical protein
VAAGDKLGVIGNSGMMFGMHLYFGMLINGHPVDPAPYLGLSACDAGPSIVHHPLIIQIAAQAPVTAASRPPSQIFNVVRVDVDRMLKRN